MIIKAEFNKWLDENTAIVMVTEEGYIEPVQKVIHGIPTGMAHISGEEYAEREAIIKYMRGT